MLEGSARQIWGAFAMFVIVETFKVDVRTVAMMLAINSLVTMFMNPRIGVWIDQWGERKAMMIGYGGLIFVFLAFALNMGGLLANQLISTSTLAILIYFTYSTMFAFNMLASPSYINKIARPGELGPSLAMGITCEHVVGVTIPIIGGYLGLMYGNISHLPDRHGHRDRLLLGRDAPAEGQAPLPLGRGARRALAARTGRRLRRPYRTNRPLLARLVGARSPHSADRAGGETPPLARAHPQPDAVRDDRRPVARVDNLLVDGLEVVAPEHVRDERLYLDLREVDADADPLTAAEGNERVWSAVLLPRRREPIGVESLGIREDVGEKVPGGERKPHRGTGGDGVAAELELREDAPRHVHHRRVEPAGLLHEVVEVARRSERLGRRLAVLLGSPTPQTRQLRLDPLAATPEAWRA